MSSLDAIGSVPDGKSTIKHFVEHTPEFKRVFALPRREQGMPDWAVREMTEWLKEPDGTWSLREVQAQALKELYDIGGVFVAAGVGHGKTLISLLAGEVVAAERPTLVVPASLRDKTVRETLVVYQDQFRVPTIGLHSDPDARLKIISYEQLGRADYSDWLQRRNPDLLIFDEVHKLRNPAAAVTRRVSRFMATRVPTKTIKVVAMSGTITSRSIKDFAHVLAWCLGSEFTPLPQLKEELDVWARAVDREVERRPDPGALTYLMKQQEGRPSLEQVRDAVSRRISDTPGVVYTQTASVDASIYIDFLKVQAEGSADRIALMRQTKELEGDELLPQDLWRHSRAMSLGFYYKWDPPGPPAWMEARSAWRRFVRGIIGDDPEASHYDSELPVANAVDRMSEGKLLDGDDPIRLARGIPLLQAWRDIRDTFKPNPVAQWFSDSAMQDIAASLKHPTLIWVDQTATGQRLSEVLGVPYFARKGRDKDGRLVDDWDPKQHAVLSVSANHFGRNLQGWNHNLILSPSPKGDIVQQLMGRSHRQGQTKDEVYFTLVLGDDVNRRDYERSVKDAHYQQTMTKEPQKLLLATVIR